MPVSRFVTAGLRFRKAGANLGGMENNPMSSPKSFPEALREIMQRTERTSAWLAGKCGVTHTAVHNWREGKARPTETNVYQMIAAFQGTGASNEALDSLMGAYKGGGR